MQQYETKIDGGKLIIDGFPDAAKVISVSALAPGLSRNLADLALHRLDLMFARDCLADLHDCGSEVASEALWRSAIIYYCKCFDDTARARKFLRSGEIFDRGDPRKLHRYFMTLRNKHIAHDENAYLQAHPVAVIAGEDKGYSVEKVLYLTFQSRTRDETNRQKLGLLVTHVLSWTEARIEEYYKLIRVELEKHDYQVLLQQPDRKYHAPAPSDHSSTRQTEPDSRMRF